MSHYDRYVRLCDEISAKNIYDRIDQVIEWFYVSPTTAQNAVYITTRSWFKPKMFDELIRLDTEDGFKPNVFTGEFKWDGERFIPEEVS